MARRAFITPGLNQVLKTVSEGTEVDTLLFGEALSVRIKTAKEVDKISKELEKPSTSANTFKKFQGKYKEAGGSKSSRGAGTSRYPGSNLNPPKNSPSNRRGGQKPQYFRNSNNGRNNARK